MFRPRSLRAVLHAGGRKCTSPPGLVNPENRTRGVQEIPLSMPLLVGVPKRTVCPSG